MMSDVHNAVSIAQAEAEAEATCQESLQTRHGVSGRGHTKAQQTKACQEI
jgi:hypothetical protein